MNFNVNLNDFIKKCLMMFLDDVIYQFPGDTRQGEGQSCGFGSNINWIRIRPKIFLNILFKKKFEDNKNYTN